MKGMMTAVTCQVLGRFLWSDDYFLLASSAATA